MAITAEQVMKIAGDHPAGVTIDLIHGRVLTDVGFCVAYGATQHNHGYRGLLDSMAHATGPNGSGIIGAWHDGKEVYYDSVKRYHTRTAAVDAAQKERQIAIYNMKTQQVENIMIEGAGFSAKSPGSFIPSIATGRKRSHSI